MSTARAVEAAARAAYGRLLARLARESRDVAAAEDALADALVAALRRWPETGVPASPEAWLLTAARRQLGAAAARRGTAQAGAITQALLAEERAGTPDAEPDHRLALMFVCAHPAIAAEVQAPLMLQLVLGLDAARIAAAFQVAPATMGQRLVRAKARVRDAGISFAIPPAGDRPARLGAVRAAIYAAFGTGWDAIDGAETMGGLATEAIWLARVADAQMPDDPETLGLLALMLLCEARRPARRDAAGGFVPLAAQDVRRWRPDLQLEAETRLRRAATLGQPGRYQLEAAIQSLHAEQCLTGRDLSRPLVQLYDALIAHAPSLGAQVARAAALGAAGAVAEGLAALDALAARGANYQPWWAARARLLAQAGQTDAARAATSTAAGLASDPAVRAWLLAGINGPPA